MRAIFKTACGCTRELDMLYPPKQQVLLPLMRSFGSLAASDEVTVASRSFRIERFENRGPHLSVAEYREEF